MTLVRLTGIFFDELMTSAAESPYNLRMVRLGSFVTKCHHPEALHCTTHTCHQIGPQVNVTGVWAQVSRANRREVAQIRRRGGCRRSRRPRRSRRRGRSSLSSSDVWRTECFSWFSCPSVRLSRSWPPPIQAVPPDRPGHRTYAHATRVRREVM